MPGQALIEFGSEKQSKKRVTYTGADELKVGYLLCYERDSTTSGAVTTAQLDRATRVEKPSSTNIGWIAGFVTSPLPSITTAYDRQIEIVELDGHVIEMYTDASCTINSTKLYAQIDSYAVGTGGQVLVGTALQTVDRSTTNGTVPVVSVIPDLVNVSDAEVNSSTTFTTAIWQNFPVAALRKDPSLGTFLEYDPTFRPEQQIPERAEYTGTHNSVTDTHVAATTLAAIEHNLVLSSDASVADNDAVAVQFPGPVVLSGGNPWAFEVDFDVVSVTNADAEIMVGLMSAETLGNAVPFADGGVIAATVDGLYFDVKSDDGDSLDVSYVATGETAVVHQAGAGVPAANTAITVGMYYNGTTIATYVNGTAKTAIAAADIADVTTDVFPAAVTTYLTAALKGDSGVADGDDLNIRAFRVAQLA